MGETLTIRTSSSTDVIKVVERGPQGLTGPQGPAGEGGAIADGDKGDITVSASGATWTIDNNAVTSGKIASSAVTETKIATNAVTNTRLADMLGNTIKGCVGDPEELGNPTDLTVDQTRTLLGLAATDSVTFEEITVSGAPVNEFYPGEGVVNCGKLNLATYAVDLGGGTTGDGFGSIVFGAINGGITLKGPEGDITTSKVINIPNASGTIAINPMTTAGDIVVGGTSGAPARLALGTASQQLRVNSGQTSLEYFTPPAELVIACSDETSNLTTGTAKVTFRMPYAMTLSSVRASVNTAPTGSTLIVDINEGGSTILSTKLSIDASELTSTTAATAAVISDTALADDAEITIDIDQIGSTVAGKGLKVVLKGTRA
jgi:hypothetical protein